PYHPGVLCINIIRSPDILSPNWIVRSYSSTVLTHPWPFLVADDSIINAYTLEVGIQGEIFPSQTKAETIIYSRSTIGRQQLEIIAINPPIRTWGITISSDIFE